MISKIEDERSCIDDNEHGASPDSIRPACSMIENMGDVYRLTPAEMCVLQAVMEVGGIRNIAQALAVSPTTVKTHLRHLFQKTGATGQVDLIRLVVRTASRSER